MFTRLRRLLYCLVAFAALAGIARAAEEIRNFEARIEIGSDGTLDIVERITVNAEGQSIRRGIFRDIPLRFEDASGRQREVGLEVVSVTRDGSPERYAEERGSGIVRIRIGDPDRFLTPGEHIYEIAYRTDRQIRFFDEHDELYWNVTGNGWAFPIIEASADISLPGNAVAGEVAYYTGPFGSTESAAGAERLEGGNRIVVTAQRRLAPYEGLTAVVALPKGVVSPPSAEQLREWWLRDNAAYLAGGIGLIIVVLYYLWAWARVGRDPPEGVVVPRWDAPGDVSPALANYIDKKGFRGQGWDALSAAVLNLAVKGLVELEDLSGTLTIRRTDAAKPRDLPVGEAAILRSFGEAGDTLRIDKDNGTRVQSMGTRFRGAMESEHRNRFYLHNRVYVIVGAVLSVATLVACLFLFGRIDEEFIASAVGMIVPTIVLSVFAVNLGRGFRNARSLGARLGMVAATAFAGFVALSVMSGVVIGFLGTDFEFGLPLTIAGIVLVNLVFFFLMGAPTPIGRRMMDHIAGLRQYLTLAEKDRMNMQGAPQMSPRHFETLLPFAVALGVEKPWADAFQNWLASAAAAQVASGYTSPSWYSGDRFSSANFGRGMSDMAGSMADSFTASLPAPKSSSSGFSSGGGGGGFSGGGGGGGGGGGW